MIHKEQTDRFEWNFFFSAVQSMSEYGYRLSLPDNLLTGNLDALKALTVRGSLEEAIHILQPIINCFGIRWASTGQPLNLEQHALEDSDFTNPASTPQERLDTIISYYVNYVGNIHLFPVSIYILG